MTTPDRRGASPYRSALDRYPSYVRQRDPETTAPSARRPLRPWAVASVAYLLGAAVTFVLGLVLGTLGLAASLLLAVTADDPSTSAVVTMAVAVFALVFAAGVAAQAAYLKRRGAPRPVLASIVATACGNVVGEVAGTLQLGWPVLHVILAATSITVLAVMITASPPPDRTR